MDKALLDYEVSIDADCKLATVGKPFAIEGETLSVCFSIFVRTGSVEDIRDILREFGPNYSDSGSSCSYDDNVVGQCVMSALCYNEGPPDYRTCLCVFLGLSSCIYLLSVLPS